MDEGTEIHVDKFEMGPRLGLLSVHQVILEDVNKPALIILQKDKPV